MKLGIIAKSWKKTNFLFVVREPMYQTESTVDLFQQEATRHLVSECEWVKGDAEIRPVLQRLRKPFMASDYKHQIASGLVTVSAKPRGKRLGRETLSSRLQQHNVVRDVNPCQQFFAFQHCQSAIGNVRPRCMDFT
jgi:hypothetical protein